MEKLVFATSYYEVISERCLLFNGIQHALESFTSVKFRADFSVYPVTSCQLDDLPKHRRTIKIRFQVRNVKKTNYSIWRRDVNFCETRPIYKKQFFKGPIRDLRATVDQILSAYRLFIVVKAIGSKRPGVFFRKGETSIPNLSEAERGEGEFTSRKAKKGNRS